MAQNNKCNICNQTFHSDQELQDHLRTAHPSQGKKEGDRPSSEQEGRQDKIAS